MAFSEVWGRFVLIKRYQRKCLQDVGVSRELGQRLRRTQARFQGGIAYPLAAGIADGRVFHETEVLPGHSLLAFVRRNGRLSGAAIQSLSALIVDRLSFVREHYGFFPSLLPEAVILCRDERGAWLPWFADYPLWPGKQTPGPAEEERAVQGVAILLYYIASRKIVSSFEVLREAWPILRTSVPAALVPVFDFLLRTQAEPSRLTLRELKDVLVATPGEGRDEGPVMQEPRVDSLLLESLPPVHRLESRFTLQGGGRCLVWPATFEAHDQLRHEPRRVHLLPALEPGGKRLRSIIAQARRLSQARPQKGLLPVEDVMCDPAGCVIAERHPHGISLHDLIERRSSFRLREAAALLGNIGRSLLSLRLRGWKVFSLLPQDIYLDGSLLRGSLDRRALSGVEVRFLSFPSNFHFGSSSSLAGSLPLLTPRERGRVTRNWHRPEFAFFVLAATLLRQGQSEVAPWPRGVGEALRQAFLSQSGVLAHAVFLARLRWITRSRAESAVEELSRSEASTAAF
jgi:hypothetical protein